MMPMIESRLEGLAMLGLLALAFVILVTTEYRHSRKQEKKHEH